MVSLISSLENEEWVELEKFPTYFISNYGRLKRKLSKEVEKLYNPTIRYPVYYFRTPETRAKGKKADVINVHKLVADNFLVNPKTDINMVIDHKDGDKMNYHVNNLEWISSSENLARAYKNGQRKNNYLGYDKNNRPVVALNIETKEVQEFGGVRVAERELGLSSSSVKDVCKGRASHAQGWFFMYYEEYIKNGFPENIKPIPQYNKKGIQQISLNTGEVLHTFESAAEAEKATGALRSKISTVCNGHRKSAGGYKWKFVEA